MEGKKLVQMALITAALGAACYFGFKNAQTFSSENPDISSRKIWFLCLNEKCKNGFQVSLTESRAYAAEHPGYEVPCPKCAGKDVQAGFMCPSCQKVMLPVGHASVPKNCPYCKAVLPRDLQ